MHLLEAAGHVETRVLRGREGPSLGSVSASPVQSSPLIRALRKRAGSGPLDQPDWPSVCHERWQAHPPDRATPEPAAPDWPDLPDTEYEAQLRRRLSRDAVLSDYVDLTEDDEPDCSQAACPAPTSSWTASRARER